MAVHNALKLSPELLGSESNEGVRISGKGCAEGPYIYCLTSEDSTVSTYPQALLLLLITNYRNRSMNSSIVHK